MENTIEQQAASYAAMIIRQNRNDLVFFPLRKSMQATSNVFRRAVLETLLNRKFPAYSGKTQKQWLAYLTETVKESGYYIHEVDSADYDSKQYKAEIARQLRKSGNSKVRVKSRTSHTRPYNRPLFA